MRRSFHKANGAALKNSRDIRNPQDHKAAELQRRRQNSLELEVSPLRAADLCKNEQAMPC